MVLWSLRRFALKIVSPLLAVLTLLYFSFHIIRGERGLESYKLLTKRVAHLEAKLVHLNLKNVLLEKRIAFIATKVDQDLLMTQAWLLLGWVSPSTVIMLLPARQMSRASDIHHQEHGGHSPTSSGSYSKKSIV